MAPLTLQQRAGNWREIIRTQNLADGRPMDAVSRWLLITRASVFTMTLISALVGGLLAVGTAGPRWDLYGLAVIGLVIAHAANNMINDYFDSESGVDEAGYARLMYAPHPIASGLISRRGLVGAIMVLNLVDLVILAYIAAPRGWPVVALALAGLFISVFYVAPPLRLKHHGLGEPAVAVVWGPLMIGGSYYVATGTLPAAVVLVSLPYALLVATVLFGKHIDKLEADAGKGIRTLPVILGRERSKSVARLLMVLFFPAVLLLVATAMVGPWPLLVVLALPRLRETLATYREPTPESPPEGYPLWPLWYVAWAFRFNRRAGGLFVLGLAMDAVLPVTF